MKKLFLKRQKNPTEEENREFLETSGIPVNTGYTRKSKFSGYSDYAKQLANQRGSKVPPAPSGSAGEVGGGGSVNPYASSNTSYSSYKSGGSSDVGVSGGVYGGDNGGSGESDSPYARAQSSYASRYGGGAPLERTETQDTGVIRDKLFQGLKSSTKEADVQSVQYQPTGDEELDELNERPSDINTKYGEQESDTSHIIGTGPGGEVTEEDQDVEAIKTQIRFTKQQSVNSTRNALRYAQEAEESGRNTLGMLGSQGERIANTEQTLALAEAQNRIAEEKARELKVLNRPLFQPHINNPFNKNKREMEREAKLAQRHRQAQRDREFRREAAYESEQRIAGSLSHTGPSDTAQKYKKRDVVERKKYQFEEDSEDEDLENEIDDNLDSIAAATSKLKKLALAAGEEVSTQNDRLDNIANKTDELDVNVHLNTARLANIK